MKSKTRWGTMPSKVGKGGKVKMFGFAAHQWLVNALDEASAEDEHLRTRSKIIVVACTEWLQRNAPYLIKKHQPKG